MSLRDEIRAMNLRDDIAGMSDAEAKEYLIDRFEDPSRNLVIYAGHVRTGTRRQLQILAILLEARNRVVSFEYISARLYDLTGREFLNTDIGVHVSNIRKTLARSGIPLEIVSRSGIGYELHLPEGYRFPWAEEIR